MLPEGPPAWPPRDERVQAALLAAWEDGSWGKYHGGHVTRLENELASMHGVPHALACASGTFAVELALRGLKIGPGDEVALAAYDFGGNFRAIEAVGARPVLVDIEADSFALDLASLEGVRGPALRCVIVSHLHGSLADMQAIRAWCDQHGVALVEDACQTPGATVEGRIAGSWGDVGVLSFGGSKLLTAGRGGAIVTADPHVAQRAKIFCERGNHAFPLSELQAAVLLPQLARLAERNAVRLARVERLLRGIAECADLVGLTLPAPRGAPSFYKLGWRYRPALSDAGARARLIAALQREGVAVDAGFRGFVGRSAARCRRAESLAQAEEASVATVILHHPVLLAGEETIDRVALAVRKVCRAYQ